MTIKQNSFSKIEQDLLPDYRSKMGAAESTEDVKKFFVYNIIKLIKHASNDQITLDYTDIALDLDNESKYVFSENQGNTEELQLLIKNSDLSNIITRFALTAKNHYQHLEKNRDKTESKIRRL